MRTLYAVIYALGLVLSSPWWLLRSLLGPGRLRILKARFLGPPAPPPKGAPSPRVWVHSLSLGEANSARGLILELKERGFEPILSSTTPTGLAASRSAFPGLPVLPHPLDLGFSVGRFLRAAEPDCLIIVETDVWPGLLHHLKDRRIPAFLVSARLSPRSLANYRRVRFFWGGVLRLLSGIAAQTEEDRLGFIGLGADPARVRATGSLKFDSDPGATGPGTKGEWLSRAGWPGCRYLVAGSTHRGEERLIVDAFLEISPEFPDLRLVVAPRDKDRFGEAWALLSEAFPGAAARRSEAGGPDAGEGARPRAFLLDSLGELSSLYAVADLAIIGKSFPGPHEGGGHNPLEAAAKGKAVLSGPRVHNFKWMFGALRAAGAAEIVEAGDLAGRLLALFRDPRLLEAMGRKGREFALAHAGSAKRTLDFLAELGLPRPPGGDAGGADAQGPGGQGLA
jgi:3-deoxy-D-manno-octulosonic-acid transferase